MRFLQEQKFLMDWHVTCDENKNSGLIIPLVKYKENKFSEVKKVIIKRFERTKRINKILNENKI